MRKLKLTKVIAGALVVASTLALNPTGVSAAWKKSTSGWWYTEGNSWATGWRNINSNWYYFHSDGYMAIQEVVDGCYVNENGAWVDDSNLKVSAAKSQDLVKKYLNNNGKYTPKYVQCCAEEGNSWVIHCYDMIDDGNGGGHTATSGWYYVDKNTGNISKMY